MRTVRSEENPALTSASRELESVQACGPKASMKKPGHGCLWHEGLQNFVFSAGAGAKIFGLLRGPGRRPAEMDSTSHSHFLQPGASEHSLRSSKRWLKKR